ncbi:hypothetical protein K432DRAFT_447165 [Lepidopterella palustris CBS 459.81]|uniref:Uncharacterized protein n=1 Tax=Lepidopterella palustris CBS 459.81 TaxID=1314670 RepID=A0A8E2DZL9_9PEZI|nr:hypothetical protein K432DRAFT_447165 [Lepidopterella palustris CBS 459.81]
MVSRILNDKSDSIQTAPEESVHSAKDGPSGEAPANEYPTDHAPPEESPAEEPLAEEPLAEEPLAEEPLAEEPTPEEPPPEEPLAEEPPPEEPAAEEPADDSLTYDLGPAPEFDYPEPDYLEPDHRPSSPVCEISYPECEVEAISKPFQEAISEPCEEGSHFTESENTMESESGVCPNRAKHLLDGDMWKDCRQCRAMLCQVAIQLARMTHVNEDGYETVDRVLIE